MVHFIFQSSCIFDIWLTFWGRSNPFYWRKLSQWQLLQSASQSSPGSAFVMGWGLGLGSWKESRSAEWQDRFHGAFPHLDLFIKSRLVPPSLPHTSLSETLHQTQPSWRNRKEDQNKKKEELAPKSWFSLEWQQQWKLAHSKSRWPKQGGNEEDSRGFQEEESYRISSLCSGGLTNLNAFN